MSVRVLIADDFRMSRTVFEQAVEMSDKYELVSSVESAEKALDVLKTTQVDLCIMDVVMAKGQSGLAISAEIKKIYPFVRILMVTSMPEVSFIERARQAGVDSFWYKEIQEQPILEIMDRTMAGESIYPDHAPIVSIGNTVSTDFTDREIAVLREITGGLSNQEIGEKLGITERTVKMHITNMLQKTGFRTRLELAVRARTGGIVIPENE
ncbi:MAG: response regulator transcription factor [Butyrivibrio sp.]|nr:response regulator transcription factor [Butyrivibrio sp.]